MRIALSISCLLPRLAACHVCVLVDDVYLAVDRSRDPIRATLKFEGRSSVVSALSVVGLSVPDATLHGCLRTAEITPIKTPAKEDARARSLPLYLHFELIHLRVSRSRCQFPFFFRLLLLPSNSAHHIR